MDFILAAGRPTANAFLECYTAHAGIAPGFEAWLLVAATRPLPDPAVWLPSYELAGYLELTPALLRRRLGGLVRAIA